MDKLQNEQRIPGYSNRQPGQTDSGSGNTSAVDRETISGTPNGTTPNKVSFLFDPDYYANWSGRRVSRFSYTDKMIPFVILIMIFINLFNYLNIFATGFNHTQILMDSPLSMFGYATTALMCMFMGVNSENPGKFKQLAITTFAMWLLSLVLICMSIFFMLGHIQIPINYYEFLPSLSGVAAFGLIGSAGIVYIFNTVFSVKRLKRLSILLFAVSLFGISQFIFGQYSIDAYMSKSMELFPVIICMLASVFLYRTSKKVSALYHVEK
jgi:hypothetical protein